MSEIGIPQSPQSPRYQAAFEGHGPTYTEPFRLEAGVATFHGWHLGTGAFVVRLLSSEGGQVHFVFDLEGEHQQVGRAIVVATGGLYLLDVDVRTPCQWRVCVNPTRPPSGVTWLGHAAANSVAPASLRHAGAPGSIREPSRPRPLVDFEQLSEAVPTITVESLSLPHANPHPFNSGSFGWRSQGKALVDVNGVAVPVSADVILTVTQSRSAEPERKADFYRLARPIDTRQLKLQARIRMFRTGSFGWWCQESIRLPLGEGAEVEVNAQVTVTVRDSKPSSPARVEGQESTPESAPVADGDVSPPGEDPPSLDVMEQQHIMRVLDHTAGNKTRAARILGITPATLYNKLKLYGL